MKKRVLVYVNSSYGVGHYVRVARIVRALLASGACEVVLLAGGVPFESLANRSGVTPILLSPLTFLGSRVADTFVESDSNRQCIVSSRRDTITSTIRGQRYDVVLLEYFPFSKFELAGEVEHLLDEAASAKHKPQIIISLRDIIDIRAQEHEENIAHFFEKHCPTVLVHGDERFCRIEDSFPPARRIVPRPIYTGFVTSPVKRGYSSGMRPILFAMGGGRDGREIVDAAVSLARIAPEQKIIVFPGPFLPDSEIDRLRTVRESHVSFSLGVFDEFSATLGRAHSLVCQAGYNTVWEAVASGIPLILRPRDRQEQQMRGALLACAGVARVASNAAEAACLAQEAAPAASHSYRFDGAEKCAQVLRSLWG